MGPLTLRSCFESNHIRHVSCPLFRTLLASLLALVDRKNDLRSRLQEPNQEIKPACKLIRRKTLFLGTTLSYGPKLRLQHTLHASPSCPARKAHLILDVSPRRRLDATASVNKTARIFQESDEVEALNWIPHSS